MPETATFSAARAEQHDLRHHDDATTLPAAQYHPFPSSSPLTKPSPKILSLLLKALIMSLLTSLFFLFLGVAAIVLLHLCLAGRHFHRNHRRQQTPNFPDHGDLVNFGYSREDLHKLPRFRYFKSLNLGSECAVCLENFRDDQLCRSLPDCHHVFHLNCIDSWLVKVPACPLCRAHVQLNSGVSSSSSAGIEEFKQIGTSRA